MVKTLIDQRVIKISVILALMYCIMFNSAVMAHKFEYYQANILTGVLELVKDFIYNFIILFLCFVGLSFSQYIFIPGSLFLFITGAMASYYLFFLGISPSLTMMPAIFGTNQTEVMELVSLKLIIWCTISSIMCIYCVWHYMPRKTLNLPTRITTFMCLILIICNTIIPKYHLLRSYFPFQYLHNAYIFLFAKDTKFVKQDISMKYNFVNNADQDVIGILVIGESTRYGNLGINGYGRNTTPNIEKLANLVNYKAISCASVTYLAVPCMLSRLGEQDLDKVEKETGFLSILTKLGFDTTWIGTQSITKYYRNKLGGSCYDEVKFNLIPGGSFVVLPNDFDMKMIPYFELKIKGSGKKFIVLHSTGSHWRYAYRYPEEFQKFIPAMSAKNTLVDPSGVPHNELVNTYDNTILYMDYFLSEVINRLKDKNAFVIYASDHGESLGENGIFEHSSEKYIKEQREVPIIVWFSEKYKNNHLDKWQAIQSFKDKTISHDYIFHTILDCLNVESEIVDKSLSLCRKFKNVN